MQFLNLPKELILKIKEYLIAKCNECNNNFPVYDLEYDITTIYYKAIFDDDFPFPRIHKTYKFLCKKCIIDLKEKLIAPLKY